jgi:peptide/nickel transport system permease protein
VLVFIVRRLLISIPVIIASSILVFLMVASAGDPLAELAANPNISQEALDVRREALHLDDPLPQRYAIWAGNFIQGDFGNTINGTDVRSELFSRLGVTLRMILISQFVALVLAIGAGVLAAVRQYTVSDYVVTFTGFLFISTPLFWFAGVLKEWAAIRLNNLLDEIFNTDRRFIFTVGESTPNFEGSTAERILDYAGHLILPTIALAAVTYAAWSRFQRASMLEVLGSDYMRLARAKGLPWRRVLVRHGLRTALIPLTTVVAINVGAIIGGALITERVFVWHGMGELLTESVRQLDVNMTLAWLMISAVAIILANLVADILYAYLDPRIRRS